MTTQREGQRLKEAYRLALNARDVARHWGEFRAGRIVRFHIDDETGFSDGLAVPDRVALAGEFQLRYGPANRPDGLSDYYSVWGRVVDATRDSGWMPVDGPWKCGEGPFDTKRKELP